METNDSDQSSKLPEMNLLSLENLDRSSPDLWPKTTTDLNDFIAQIKASTKSSSNSSTNAENNSSTNASATSSQPSKWMSELNKEDMEFLNEMTTMSLDQLVQKCKELMDVAYQLEVEESDEMMRGKLLNVFEKQ